MQPTNALLLLQTVGAHPPLRELYADLLTSVDPWDTPLATWRMSSRPARRVPQETYRPPDEPLFMGMSLNRFLWLGVAALMAIPAVLVAWFAWACR